MDPRGYDSNNSSNNNNNICNNINNNSTNINDTILKNSNIGSFAFLLNIFSFEKFCFEDTLYASVSYFGTKSYLIYEKSILIYIYTYVYITFYFFIYYYSFFFFFSLFHFLLIVEIDPTGVQLGGFFIKGG